MKNFLRSKRPGRDSMVLYALILISVVLATASAVVASYVAGRLVFGDYFNAPLKYMDSGIEKTAYCPGDTINYFATLSIDTSDFNAIQSVTSVSIWSQSQQVTHVFETTPRYAAWTQPAIVTNRDQYRLPIDIPPGEYELRRIVSSFTGGSDAVSMPFLVLDNCE